MSAPLGQGPPAAARPSTVTIGVFDGVHRGQQVLIQRTCADARAHGRPAIAVTFEPHPASVLGSRQAPLALLDLTDRIALLTAAGINEVDVLEFTPDLAQVPAEDFLTEHLCGRLRAAHIVIGHDFRFGAGARGDVELLRRLAAVHGFSVERCEPVCSDRLPAPGIISATAVRAAIVAGEVALATDLLGRPHLLRGTVVRGDQRGRVLGYPTANLVVAEGRCWPADGVYAVRLHLGAVPVPLAGTGLPAVASVGANVTFDGAERRLEVHVLDRDDLDLYGEPTVVEFIGRIRPMVAFPGVADLLAAMAQDVDAARELLAPGLAAAPTPPGGVGTT